MMIRLSMGLAALFVGVSAWAQAGWKYDRYEDDFEGTVKHRAQSTIVRNSAVKDSVMNVRCENSNIEVFFKFGYLNPTDVDYDSYGNKEIGVMYKWGVNGKPTRTWMNTSNDGKALFVSSAKDEKEWAIKAARHDVLGLRFNQYRYGAVTLNYDLTGSEPAIRRAFRGCGIEDLLN